MTSRNAVAVAVAAVGLAVLGAAWLVGSPVVAMAAAAVFLPSSLLLAADWLSGGVGQ